MSHIEFKLSWIGHQCLIVTHGCSLKTPQDGEKCEPRAILNLTSHALGADPEKALDAVGKLRTDLDLVERMQVASALDKGWSWAQIGRALGVSRQAVHHKYRGRRPDAPEAQPERPALDPRIGLAVRIGRMEAAGRRDAVAGTEHLLAGLVQQGEGGAVEVLQELGVTVSALRRALVAVTPSGTSKATPSSMPLSRRARSALALASTYATASGNRLVSDVHLLRALFADPSANAVQVLRAIGITSGDVATALKARQETAMGNRNGDRADGRRVSRLG